MNIYVFQWDNMQRWIISSKGPRLKTTKRWTDWKLDVLVGFDSPLLSAEVGCTLRINNERGVYTENWSVTYKDLSQIPERGERQKAEQKTGGITRFGAQIGWLSRGRERESERKKKKEECISCSSWSASDLSKHKQEMQLHLDHSPPPLS